VFDGGAARPLRRRWLGLVVSVAEVVCGGGAGGAGARRGASGVVNGIACIRGGATGGAAGGAGVIVRTTAASALSSPLP
jgi:hypothetical protein